MVCSNRIAQQGLFAKLEDAAKFATRQSDGWHLEWMLGVGDNKYGGKRSGPLVLVSADTQKRIH